MIVLWYLLVIVCSFIICLFVNSIIATIFNDSCQIIEIIIMCLFDFIISWRFGLYMARKFLYIKLKKLYKNKEEKGE